MSHIYLSVLLIALALSPVVHAEDKSQAEEVIKESKGVIPLIDAVRLTLALNPQIKLQEETVRYEAGGLLIEKGRFDMNLLVNLDGKFTQRELDYETHENEVEKRENLQDSITGYEKEIKMLNTMQRYTDAIERGGSRGDITDYIPAEGPELEFEELSELRWAQVDYDGVALVSDILNETPEERQEWFQTIREAYKGDIDNAFKEREEKIDELARLGPVPSAIEKSEVAADVALKKTFRTGVELTQSLEVSENGYQFRHKEQEVPPTYESTIKFDLMVPLGKNRGRESSGAGEAAADLLHEASRRTLRNITSQEVAATIKAYWEMVAALEKYRLYQASTTARRRILKVSQTLVDADELPRTELARNYAGLAGAQATESAAKKNFESARLNLAQAIGLEVSDLASAPLPGEGLPEPADIEMIEGLAPDPFVEYAVSRREDYQAALSKTEAAAIKYRAAQIDLAPKADVGMYLSYSGMNANKVIGEGLEDSFRDWTGPSIGGRANIEWAIQNSSAKGNLMQSEASRNIEEISKKDLLRLIQTNIINIVEPMKDNVRQLVHIAEAIRYYKQTMKTEVVKFKANDSTLLAVIDTEEQLTNTIISQTDAKAEYAKLVADLRYQTASFMMETEDGFEIREQDLRTLPATFSTATE